ncbi:MAG: phytanoyl-CoA dioxygenase family protein [Proteobacteria bacterium]|nr:phytanoyl-CoA dioxygenase family protein [Pseudomonadota bacterium]
MQLHSLNTQFSWTTPTGPFQIISDAQAQAYGEDGGFILTDAFTQPQIQAVIDAIDPLEAESVAFLRTRKDQKFGIARAEDIIFSPHLVARSGLLADFSRHPVFQALCADLIGPDVRLYWDQLVYKKPATPDEFPWHQDNGYTYLEPQQYLTCWLALTDATLDNGCPWILPGMHRRGTFAHQWTDLGFSCVQAPEGARALELKAGSIAVFSSLTPHRTGPNLTDATRKAYILQYAADGAVMHPHGKPPQPASNPDWQYPILRQGQPA